MGRWSGKYTVDSDDQIYEYYSIHDRYGHLIEEGECVHDLIVFKRCYNYTCGSLSFLTVKLHQLASVVLPKSRLKTIELPVHSAAQGGVWYQVFPRRIRGLIVPGRHGSRIFVQVKHSMDYYERMTHCEWEPVYVGEEADPV